MIWIQCHCVKFTVLTIYSALNLSLFSTRRICSREHRIDWLATNTDDIITHHIHFLLVRTKKNRQVVLFLGTARHFSKMSGYSRESRYCDVDNDGNNALVRIEILSNHSNVDPIGQWEKKSLKNEIVWCIVLFQRLFQSFKISPFFHPNDHAHTDDHVHLASMKLAHIQITRRKGAPCFQLISGEHGPAQHCW